MYTGLFIQPSLKLWQFKAVCLDVVLGSVPDDALVSFCYEVSRTWDARLPGICLKTELVSDLQQNGYPIWLKSPLNNAPLLDLTVAYAKSFLVSQSHLPWLSNRFFFSNNLKIIIISITLTYTWLVKLFPQHM
jgi:hypothetical protein